MTAPVGRPPLHPGDPFILQVSVKLNREVMSQLDRLRGNRGRGLYLRELLEAEIRQRSEPASGISTRNE